MICNICIGAGEQRQFLLGEWNRRTKRDLGTVGIEAGRREIIRTVLSAPTKFLPTFFDGRINHPRRATAVFRASTTGHQIDGL